eukprot:704041-Pelagomonas_calceolata.AAC.3
MHARTLARTHAHTYTHSAQHENSAHNLAAGTPHLLSCSAARMMPTSSCSSAPGRHRIFPKLRASRAS